MIREQKMILFEYIMSLLFLVGSVLHFLIREENAVHVPFSIMMLFIFSLSLTGAIQRHRRYKSHEELFHKFEGKE